MNCLLKQATEGKREGREEATVRRGRKRKQLLDVIKEKRGYCGHILCMSCILKQVTKGKSGKGRIDSQTRKKT